MSNTESCSSSEHGQDPSCLRFDGRRNCSKPYYLPEQLLKGHQDTFNERLNSSIHTILIITAFLSSDFEMQSSVLRRGVQASGPCLGPLQPGMEGLVFLQCPWESPGQLLFDDLVCVHVCVGVCTCSACTCLHACAWRGQKSTSSVIF